VRAADRDATAKFGDRFVLVRLNASPERRAESGRSALLASGHEERMRLELLMIVKELFANVQAYEVPMPDTMKDSLLEVADLVTCARTAVEYDRTSHHVEFAHQPEAPTRLTKQLLQVFRGTVLIGKTPKDAFRLVLRLARDTMPPRRLEVLQELATTQEELAPGTLATRLYRHSSSVLRDLEALHALKLVESREEAALGEYRKARYRLSGLVPPAARRFLAELEPVVDKAEPALDLQNLD
jgi:hypothetical protein